MDNEKLDITNVEATSGRYPWGVEGIGNTFLAKAAPIGVGVLVGGLIGFGICKVAIPFFEKMKDKRAAEKAKVVEGKDTTDEDKSKD